MTRDEFDTPELKAMTIRSGLNESSTRVLLSHMGYGQAAIEDYLKPAKAMQAVLQGEPFPDMNSPDIKQQLSKYFRPTIEAYDKALAEVGPTYSSIDKNIGVLAKKVAKALPKGVELDEADSLKALMEAHDREVAKMKPRGIHQ